jgi:lipoate-protein ligase A
MTRRPFAALDVYQDAIPRSAAMNMAIDEALLERVTQPSIRAYRWDHPALSFGYFGKFIDVSHYAVERDIVRRWTGGGIVSHGDDLTYSIIIPALVELFAASSRSIYAAIHAALKDVLIANGTPAELVQSQSRLNHGGWPPAQSLPSGLYALRAGSGRGASSSPSPLPARRAYRSESRFFRAGGGDADDGLAGARPSTISEPCFARPVLADVMVNGQKVAGAAQRRTRRGLLQQGSIQQVALGEDFEMRFADQLSAGWEVKPLNESTIDRAAEIARQKYGTTEWLCRR